MGELVNFITPLHESTKREYLSRLMDNKVEAMIEARKFERNYWDGDRRYGYGGYRYIPGRWTDVARSLIERYDLKPGDSVLDLGCGKGYLLYELQLLMPRLDLVGMDRSKYALSNKHPKLRAAMLHGRIEHPIPFSDESFSLVISLGALHNLTLSELSRTLPEIERVGVQGYVMVEAFRDEQEWFNLCAWCLTAESLMRPEDWIFAYEHFGYKGDYEFIFFR